MIYQQRNSMGQRYFECIRYENFRFPPHMHRHPELVYVESGELELEINGQIKTQSSRRLSHERKKTLVHISRRGLE